MPDNGFSIFNIEWQELIILGSFILFKRREKWKVMSLRVSVRGGRAGLTQHPGEKLSCYLKHLFPAWGSRPGQGLLSGNLHNSVSSTVTASWIAVGFTLGKPLSQHTPCKFSPFPVHFCLHSQILPQHFQQLSNCGTVWESLLFYWKYGWLDKWINK